jgi:hypothetical protein
MKSRRRIAFSKARTTPIDLSNQEIATSEIGLDKQICAATIPGGPCPEWVTTGNHAASK